MIGVGILAFNRPNYLRRLIASLEQQTDLHAVDFHLYLDGAVNKWSGRRYATDTDIDRCAAIFARSSLPNKWLHWQKQNVGVGVNAFDAIEALTGTYERVMLLEDDVVLSPHWLGLAHILYDELAEHPAAFSFSPGFKRLCATQHIPANMYRLRTGRFYMWCECFASDRWQAVRPVYLDFYEKFIADGDYYDRDCDAIREWHIAHGVDEHVKSQDAGRLTAITVNGMKRYQCVVNRAYSIGQHGIHFSPELYAIEDLARQTPFIFDEDADCEGFTWYG